MIGIVLKYADEHKWNNFDLLEPAKNDCCLLLISEIETKLVEVKFLIILAISHLIY